MSWAYLDSSGSLNQDLKLLRKSCFWSKFFDKTRIRLAYIRKANCKAKKKKINNEKERESERKGDSYPSNLEIRTLIMTIPFQLILMPVRKELQNTFRKMSKHAIEWENTFVICKECVPRMYKEP